MITKIHTPRVLVADDDPVTLTFFRATLEQFGCRVVAASSGADALDAARGGTFDLLLLDRRMPDFGGCRLLAALRGEEIHAPAVATSADIDAAAVRELKGGGFHIVVAKPLSRTALLEVLQPLLPNIGNLSSTHQQTQPILDDASALAASGDNRDIMHKLRSLLAAELETLPGELSRICNAGDWPELRERAHRLKASCGFCGARALAGAAAQLEITLRETPAHLDSALADLLHICRETQAQLQHQDASLPADI